MPLENGSRPPSFGLQNHSTLDSQAGAIRPTPNPETKGIMTAVSLLRQDFNRLAKHTTRKEQSPRADQFFAPGEKEALAKISPALGKRYEHLAGILRAIE